MTGILSSKIPITFRPITINSDAKNNIKYAGATETKTLPVIAQIIPIIAKTMEEPNTKNSICISVLIGVFFEYPPTYPIIIGNIASEQGDIDATKPPKNDTRRSIIWICETPFVIVKSWVKLFIYEFFHIFSKLIFIKISFSSCNFFTV